MKLVIVFCIVLFAVASVKATNKLMGTSCRANDECVTGAKCVNYECVCDPGFRVYNQKCVKVIDSDCSSDLDCIDLPHAKCENRKCVCRTEDGCSGASQNMIVSITTLAISLLFAWKLF